MEEKEARRRIAVYRRKLEWLLMVPEWEPMLKSGLQALDLPQPRRGVSLRGLLQGLLLEQKKMLISWVLETYRGSFHSSSALGVCRQLNLDLFDIRVLDTHLSARQWLYFRDTVHFALSMKHRRYKRAQQLMFNRYKAIAESIVQRKVFNVSKRDDALQEGLLGLLHAIDKCSEDERSFAGYARVWITRQIKNHLLNEHFPVHVPINRAVDFLTRKEPDSEVGSAKNVTIPRGISVDDVDALQEIIGLLYDPVAESPRGAATRADLRSVVAAAVQKLTAQEREILLRRHGGGRHDKETLRSVATSMGYSIQQINARERKALAKLKELLQPYRCELT